MKHILYLTLSLLISNLNIISAQAKSTDGEYYLVDFEKFSPPIREMAMAFEGQPAEQFLANDVMGMEHYLGDYKGKKVILWFWSREDVISTSHIPALHQALAEHDDLVVISFARGGSAEVKKYADEQGIRFPVIPNGDMFGEMAYAADLGYPRYFFIDEYGIIRQVWPSASFKKGTDPAAAIRSILSKI